MKNIIHSYHFKFGVIAVSLAIVMTVLGLSAYLTDKKDYTTSFKTASGSDLGFSITSDSVNGTFLPGDTLTLNVKAKATGNKLIYVFADIDIPSDCTLVGVGSWYKLSDDSNIYYYGSNENLEPLGKDKDREYSSESTIFTGLKLSQYISENKSFDVKITGYAIQATNLDGNTTDPATVFGYITSNTSSTTSQSGSTTSESTTSESSESGGN